MTEFKSFLPDKRPVYGILLANLPYTRRDLEKIAEGADPANFSTKLNPAPIFGLLYLDDAGLGFFVHPSEAPMAMLFRGSANAEPSEPVSIHIPWAAISSVEFVRRGKPETALRKALMLFVPRKDEECRVVWNGSEPYSLGFLLTTDSFDFEEKYRELAKRG